MTGPLHTEALEHAAQAMRHTEALIGPLGAEMVRLHVDALVHMVRGLEATQEHMTDLLMEAVAFSCEPEARHSTPTKGRP